MRTSLLPSEQHALIIKGDATMTSKEKCKTKFGLATTVAVFWMAAMPFAGAAAISAPWTSAASSPAGSTLEAQVQVLRECEEGVDYGELETFEGLHSGIVCGS
jgi:hypothetical protein